MASNRLMIVDDALIMRQRIREIAEEAGWEVVAEVPDGSEVKDTYSRVTPDLVTMDIVMPRVDGVAALKELIAMDAQAQVVMISAVNQKQKLMECIRAGAVDFIVKPFEKASLRRYFERFRVPGREQ